MSVKLDISRNSKESHTIFKIDFFLNIILNLKKMECQENVSHYQINCEVIMDQAQKRNFYNIY